MKKVFFMGAMCIIGSTYAQNRQELDTISLGEVVVSGVRAKEKHPITFTNITKKEIKVKNVASQLPVLLQGLPNVVSHSEDGTGVGATYLFVRGSDSYRTNITINGISYNDSESQGSFWYNLSDMASSAESIQLQRGVGTSTNGAGAFGASLNILTDMGGEEAGVETASFIGSYNTMKNMVKVNTGKISERWSFGGRFSKITSDGYRERASSKLSSYYTQATYKYGDSEIKALFFGGAEKTGLTWIGISKEMMKENRRYNPAGMYKENGVEKFYDNETDNYKQYHSQLHWSQKWKDNFATNVSLHHTKGKGFWEQYETWGAPRIANYSMDNDFYGISANGDYKTGKVDYNFGGAFNKYDGRHFDEVIWTSEGKTAYKFVEDEDWGYKKDGSVFGKVLWKISDKWDVFGDVQYRYVHYKADKYEANEAFNFINPKVGVNFSASGYDNFYFSYAKGTKEPNRNDYKNNFKEKLGGVKPEYLSDFELGWRRAKGELKLELNGYYMVYKDQLVLTGELNDRAYPIRKNSGKSYRAGMEADATWMASEKINVRGNVSVSKNKNIDYKEKDASGVVKNYGNTEISFSPNVVSGVEVGYSPVKNGVVSLTGKYVGSQYMVNNEDDKAKLDGYFVSNMNIRYDFYPKKAFKKIGFVLFVNNLFNNEYVASGTFEGGSAAYFPQAPMNVMAGLKFEL